MKDTTTEVSGVCRLKVRSSERSTFTEYHLTGTVEGTADVAEAAAELLAKVAATMAERNIEPIQEKLYGLSSVREEVLGCREKAYRHYGLDTKIQVTWLQGTPLQGCDFVCIQIWGIANHDGKKCVSSVENPDTGISRMWNGRGFRMLHIPFVRGTDRKGVLGQGHVAQCQQMFTNVGLGLMAHGMKFTHVVRTWIYVARLLEWYGDLNRVRTAHYQPAGLGVPGGPAFPASTGIQCKYQDEECLVDVLAVDSESPECAAVIPVNRSPRQDQSFHYGSAFSRGMSLEIEGKKTLHISGTASINTAGQSTHFGDAEYQSIETLLSIAAILENHGGSLSNITSATLFCKDQNAYEAWVRVSKLLQVPAFPKVCVLADVCRDNLLVEMEAVAVI